MPIGKHSALYLKASRALTPGPGLPSQRHPLFPVPLGIAAGSPGPGRHSEMAAMIFPTARRGRRMVRHSPAKPHMWPQLPALAEKPHPQGHMWSPAAKMSPLDKACDHQPPRRAEGIGPRELAQGCTDPWSVRQRPLLTSLSTTPRHNVSHQAWAPGRGGSCP